MTISMFVFLSPRSGETLFTHQQNPTYRNVHRFSVPISAANAAIDLYILVLPIAAVIQLQLATKHKIGMYLSELLSRIVPSTEPKSLNPFNRKTKKEFSELEKGMSACGGIQDGRLEGLPQYRVESLGTNRFRTFVGVEDQIYLKHDVTVSRQ
ncbi:hypothetical protein MMC29_000332 [Sticta canariensis]|nr:hypothetical protein [Sticta canariensis]